MAARQIHERHASSKQVMENKHTKAALGIKDDAHHCAMQIAGSHEVDAVTSCGRTGWKIWTHWVPFRQTLYAETYFSSDSFVP